MQAKITPRTKKAYIALALLIFASIVLYFNNPKRPKIGKQAGLQSAVVCFSPDGACEQVILETLQQAKKEIVAAVYTFTSVLIAEELIRAKERGVEVRLLLDRDMADDRFSRFRAIKSAGVQVVLDGDPGAIMHNKYAVVDEEIVITGSYNWTSGANKSNYENLLIIHSSELARQYKANFELLWERFK